ncbi:MAG: hypothetical protein FJ404_05075 [Verrucomicrobia bacterium]|nr:hypothetical protein [Verrucomicrobiota bacterium]
MNSRSLFTFAHGRNPRTFLLIAPLLLSLSLLAADWPTYRSDYARSGISTDTLPVRPAELWKWTSRHRPQPAWQGEAKWDGYNKVYDMKARQIFDRTFHPILADGRLYFGSSADDKIYCLNASNGRLEWAYFTEGPVRLAPTWHQGKIYAGSDDGNIYCLDAQSGTLIWKQRGGPEDRRIPGNGRVISVWPVRTSVVVQDGVAYAAAGMFPSEGVHLLALNAATGEVQWRQIQTDLPAQGYLLASRSRLYYPAGRNNPVVCDLAGGKRLQVVEGAGGTYALLSGDMLIFGPGKTGQLGAVEDGRQDQLASFEGNHMIVTPTRSFLHSDTELSALDRARYLDLARQRKNLTLEQSRVGKRLKELAKKPNEESSMQKLKDDLTRIGTRIDEMTEAMQNCILWKRPSTWPYHLILAGETLIAGGEHEIAGFTAETGEPLWTLPVQGKAYGLAASSGLLIATTDEGVIHSFGRPTARASTVPAATAENSPRYARNDGSDVHAP